MLTVGVKAWHVERLEHAGQLRSPLRRNTEKNDDRDHKDVDGSEGAEVHHLKGLVNRTEQVIGLIGPNTLVDHEKERMSFYTFPFR